VDTSSAESLIQVLLEEADVIDELVDAVVEQRESIGTEGHVALQDRMKYIQEIFFDVQAQELRRDRLAKALAEELECEPRLSSLAAVLPETERALFRGAGDRLGHSVFALKSEMTILSGLIAHNERFSAMLLSEWRRLEGGFSSSGGLDFRG
jgi:hypothetical protein